MDKKELMDLWRLLDRFLEELQEDLPMRIYQSADTLQDYVMALARREN